MSHRYSANENCAELLGIYEGKSRLRGLNIILSLPCGEQKRHNPARMKYWEIMADNLSCLALTMLVLAVPA